MPLARTPRSCFCWSAAWLDYQPLTCQGCQRPPRLVDLPTCSGRLQNGRLLYRRGRIMKKLLLTLSTFAVAFGLIVPVFAADNDHDAYEKRVKQINALGNKPGME